MRKAWTFGLLIILATCVVWVIALKLEAISKTLAMALWVFVGLAATVTAVYAPARKFLLGLSLAIPASLAAAALNAFLDAIGYQADLGGVGGFITILVLSLIFNVVLCAVGAGIGIALSRRAPRPAS